MTLFDSIRWPVSTPPTAEQLEALPPRLYYRFIDSRPGTPSANPTPEQMAAWFQNHPATAHQEAQRLRAMILDWDDDLPRS